MELKEFKITLRPSQTKDRFEARGHVADNTPVFGNPGVFRARGFLDRLESVRDAMTAGITGRAGYDEQLVQDYGRCLYEELFQGDVESGYQLSRKMRLPPDPLRIRIEAPQELAKLPWELMFCPGPNAHFLCADPTIVLVRSGRAVQAAQTIQLPLKALVVVCSPLDRVPLNTRSEITALLESLAPMVKAGMVTVDFIHGRDTFHRLNLALAQNYHILHLIGHGEDRGDGNVDLLLEDRNGNSYPIEGTRLWLDLNAVPHPRLAVLNMCKGAVASSTPPFASVAEVFLDARIPAVIAHQFEISDEAASRFSASLYGQLVKGQAVDSSLIQARRDIEPEIERNTPILLLQQDSGAVFQVVPAPHNPPDGAQWVAKANQSLKDNLWSEAASYAQEALLVQPNPQVAQLREDALLEEKLDTYLHEARFAANCGDWAAAGRFYEKYQAEAGDRRDQGDRDRVAQLRGAALAGVGFRDPLLKWRS